MFRLSQRSLNRLKDVDVQLVEVVRKSIHNSPYDFGIAWMGGYRTPTQQRRLYEKGASKCDGTDRKSRHQLGEAFDIICYKDGVITWDKNIFLAVASHIQYTATTIDIKLKWGGDWKNFPDMPHFQLNDNG